MQKAKQNFTPTTSKAHNEFRYEPLGLMCLSLITAYKFLTHDKSGVQRVKNCNFRLCGV